MTAATCALGRSVIGAADRRTEALGEGEGEGWTRSSRGSSMIEAKSADTTPRMRHLDQAELYAAEGNHPMGRAHERRR